MRALAWFTAGAATGMAYMWMVWSSVRGLRADSSPRTALVLLGSSLLRAVLVTAVLTLAVTQGVTLGLLAFGGFVLARLAGTALAASRMARGGRVFPGGS